jgi:phosphoglycerate dehydrogenase-like enzyme
VPVSSNKPRIVVAPSPARLADVCNDRCRQLIDEHFTPVWNDTGHELSTAELAERLPGASAVLTSWGSPSIADPPKELRAVAHAAGSIKRLVSRELFDRDIAVFSGARRIADSVGEYCLAATLTMLRRLPVFDAGVRAGGWKNPDVRGLELTGKRIGIISASSTARAFLRLLQPFRPTVLLYDPYLSDSAAAGLGVRKAELAEVMGCEIVSIHAPALPETEGLITKELLGKMPDGAVLVNSSRGATIDQDALFAEIAAERLFVALDVFTPEPPQLPSQLSRNVLLSPHIAGDTREGHLALMEYVVRDLIAWLERGESGPTKVDGRTWDILA